MVANNVTVSTVSDRHGASAAARGWTTRSWPSGAFSQRMVTSIGVPSGRVISAAPVRMRGVGERPPRRISGMFRARSPPSEGTAATKLPAGSVSTT